MVKAYEGILIFGEVCVLILKLLFWTLEGIYRKIVPHDEKSIAGETVLITGTGHGIGRELALKYASLGATVICVDLNPQGNQETVNDIKKLGATAVHAYECDVSNHDQVLKVAARVKDEVGDVTILVNNAGIMPTRPFLETTTEEMKKIFDINVLAHFWLLQAFLPSMIEKNHGHVVAMSSIAGLIGVPNLVPYCSSKFAVRGMMEAMREELRISSKDRKPSEIKFTTIYPYMVDTGLCKNTRIRFPSLMSMVTPQEAAAHIVSAQRRNIADSSIPDYWLSINQLMRNFPVKVGMHIADFLNSGVDSDKL